MFLPDPTQEPEAAERLRVRVLAAISPREMAYLLLVCDPVEHTVKRIAAIMGVKEPTTAGYRKDLSRKFNIKSKAGLVIFAMHWRLVPLPAWHLARSDDGRAETMRSLVFLPPRDPTGIVN